MIVAGSEQLEELRDEVLRRLDAELRAHASQVERPREFVIVLFQNEEQFVRQRDRLDDIVTHGAFVLVGYPGAPTWLPGASLGVDVGQVPEVEDARVLVALGTEVVCALVAVCEPAVHGFATRLSFSAPLAASAGAQLLQALRPRLAPADAGAVRSAFDEAILAPRPDESTMGHLQGAARLILAS